MCWLHNQMNACGQVLVELCLQVSQQKIYSASHAVDASETKLAAIQLSGFSVGNTFRAVMLAPRLFDSLPKNIREINLTLFQLTETKGVVCWLGLRTKPWRNKIFVTSCLLSELLTPISL